MTYEFLPQEEPGKPLVTLPPGFTESVMQRIADYERRQRRRWTTAIALTALCLVAGALALNARRLDDRPTAGFPRMHAGPVTPLVKPAPAQQPAPQQNAVKQARSAAPPAAHDHPVANTSAGAHPQEFVLTIDGKAYRCPADILQPRGDSAGQIEQVRNGRHGQTPSSMISRCRPDPAPRE